MKSPKPETVLVTGAAGFVGACAVRALLERGHEVHVLLRGPKNWRLADLVGQAFQPAGLAGKNQSHRAGSAGSKACPTGVTVHHGDLRDVDAVRRCLAESRPQVVLHLATHGAYESQSDVQTIMTTNVVGTQNLLAAAADVDVELFVQTGSSSEYGFRSRAMREDDRLEPNSFYAIAKAAQTHLGLLQAHRGSMPVVCLRLFSVYGPWEEPTRLIPTLLRRARAGEPLLLTSPETARDFVYVDDVLDALLDFPRLRDLGGEIVNIGSGRETKLREVVDAICSLFPKRLDVRWGAFPPRAWDTTHWSGDVTKAAELLDWKPRHTLAAGLAKTVAWMGDAQWARLSSLPIAHADEILGQRTGGVDVDRHVRTAR